ncbi:hypothetical protein CAP36_16370 [Chitinophagaceae bacterium IBVUCB2]|nr:hypothetical protein CAP36_16370 [Chitinophagaceae bacterium IBVUCB2]
MFLFLRKCVDRKVEKVTDKEVVREGEEMLGTWASKSANGYIQFRLKRDGSLEYVLAEIPARDTVKIKGSFSISAAAGRSMNYFPRLYGFRENGDTLFNFYIRSVTPYNSTVSKYDNLILSPNSVFDTIEYKFYRIKQ